MRRYHRRTVDDIALRRLTPAIAIAIFVAIAAPTAATRAQDDAPDEEPAAPEPPRPFYVSLGVGTGVRLDGSLGAAFRILEEAGLHLDGVPVGPFVGVTLAEDISNGYSMQIGLRVGWDLELLARPDFSIVVSPSVAIAFAFDVIAQSTWAYFLVQPALGVSLLLLDRMLGIWLRPIGVDVYIGEQVHGGWAALAGATIAL
jgi:hypothetical protein